MTPDMRANASLANVIGPAIADNCDGLVTTLQACGLAGTAYVLRRLLDNLLASDGTGIDLDLASVLR